MSWDEYIDNLMAPEKNVTILIGAAICGQDGSLWAASPDMKKITPDEIKKLIGKTTSFHQCGPTVAGLKCMMLKDQYDDSKCPCLQLKSRPDADGATYNIVVGKSIQAVVVAKGTKESNAAQVTKKVYTMVDYLQSKGY
ncbi:hypothetical protein PBY51_005686 [Eleginops maclovinus]|uniref:Profilin n=1 Tax=Eleginops maclovinus TaxID=56733 RepID=A0AAN7WMS2_ELEMC|nr:hypothetical protein PBY51_005686 [Eleginops maclovinus]